MTTLRRSRSEAAFPQSLPTERRLSPLTPLTPHDLPSSPSSVLTGSTACSKYQPLTPHGLPKSPGLITKDLDHDHHDHPSRISHRFDPMYPGTAYSRPTYISDLHISPVTPQRTTLPRVIWKPRRPSSSRSQSRSPVRSRDTDNSYTSHKNSVFHRLGEKFKRMRLKRVPKDKSDRNDSPLERVVPVHWSEL